MIQNNRNSGYRQPETKTIFAGFSTLAEFEARPETKGTAKEQAMVWDMLPYLKLLWMRDRGGSEVGGYAITAKDDVVHVVDFYLVDQDSTSAFCKFSDTGVGDHITDFAQGFRSAAGYSKGERIKPDNTSAIWIHTHPGNSASPSGTDMETFGSTSFSGRPWSVMFILARGGQITSRRRYNVGPEPDKGLVPVVDMDSWNPSKDMVKFPILIDQWEKEYTSLVRVSGGVRQHDRSGRNMDTQFSGRPPLEQSPGLYAITPTQHDADEMLQFFVENALPEWNTRTGRYAGWDNTSSATDALQNGVEADVITIEESTPPEMSEHDEVQAALIAESEELLTNAQENLEAITEHHAQEAELHPVEVPVSVTDMTPEQKEEAFRASLRDDTVITVN